MSLPRAIIDLEEYTESINALVYGPSNAGKTTLAGQLPNNLILATEQGTVSAARSSTKAKNVKVWEIKKWSDLEEAFVYLRDEDHPFEWVTIDSLTNMQQMMLREILGVANEKRPTGTDIDIPQIQDYQKWQNMFKRFVTDFNGLPINVLWTAQTMELEDSDGEEIVLPFIQGKKGEISRWVCAQMHLVMHYSKKKRKKEDDAVVRRLLFEEHKGNFAKDRYGIFPRVVVVAKDDEQLSDLGKLMQSIKLKPTAKPEKKTEKVTEPEEEKESKEEQQPTQKTTKTTKFRAVSLDDGDE